MADSQKTLSVSKAATLCGVGRTTVGYWIRSKKINAARPGRNYNNIFSKPVGRIFLPNCWRRTNVNLFLKVFKIAGREVKQDCVISIKNDWKSLIKVRLSVYLLREPVNAFLVLDVPLASR